MIFLILVLGFLLRLVSLNQSLWLDEATSVVVARSFDSVGILSKFSPGDFHPPLYYLLLDSWTNIFGYSEIVVRFPSIFFGVLTIYLSYLIGNEVFNKKVGLLSALLLSTSGLHLYYSQEVRMYSMAAFLISLAFYSYLKILRKMDWKFLVIFVLSMAASLLTEYLTFLMIPAFFVISIVQKKDWAWWKKYLMSYLPIVLIFSTWLPTFFKQLESGIKVNQTLPEWWNILGIISFKNIALIPIKFVFGRLDIQNNVIYALLTIVVFLLYFLIINKSKTSISLWIWLLLPIFGMILLAFYIPVIYYFRILFVLPALFILLAGGIYNLSGFKKYLGIFLIVTINLFTTSNYLLDESLHREDWKGVSKYVTEQNMGEVIVFPSENSHEAYIYYSPDAKILSSKDLRSQNQIIWFIPYLENIFDPYGISREKIKSLGYSLVLEKSFRGIGSVYLYKNENRN